MTWVPKLGFLSRGTLRAVVGVITPMMIVETLDSCGRIDASGLLAVGVVVEGANSQSS